MITPPAKDALFLQNNIFTECFIDMQQIRALPNHLFPFVWYFLCPHKVLTALYLFLPFMAGFWGPLNSRILKHILDLLPTVGQDISILIGPIGLLVLNLIVFLNITWRSTTHMRAKYIPSIINKMMGTLRGCALEKSQRFYQDTYAGSLSKQMTHLVDGIEEIITGIIPHFLWSSSLLLATFVLAYSVNPVFFLILILWFGVFESFSLFMSSKRVLLSAAKSGIESEVVG